MLFKKKTKKELVKFFPKIIVLKSIIFGIFIFISLYEKIINYYDSILSSFYNSKSKSIKVAFYNNCMRYGGIERVTSILLHYFSKEKIFIFFLITISGVLQDEFPIPNNIERISLYESKKNLFEILDAKGIDILIYNYDNREDINILNKLNKTKVLYCVHSSFFYRIYEQAYKIEDTIYQSYKDCKYVIALVPLENDYLFKKWGINSIIIENPSTFEYDLVSPSDLSQKNIIMIGRGDYFAKRFELGIKAMKNIVEEIPECQMNIISSPYQNLIDAIHNFNLENNVKIVGFQKNPEKYLRNSSLHIFPSLSEAFPMVLGEVKIFGIPSILCGLDYIILAERGTVIIYDDNPETIAKESIKILKNDKYRKKLGKEARKSMKKLTNKIICKKWIKLLRSIYNGIDKYSFSNLLLDDRKKLSEKEANIILNHQLNLLKKRVPKLNNLTLEKLKSYSLI